MLSRAIRHTGRFINRDSFLYSRTGISFRSLTTESDLGDNNGGQEELIDKEGAGRDLAKLSKLAQVLRREISVEASSGTNSPDFLLQLEKETNEAFDIIKKALDKSGRPCTVEELGDRINENIVQVPVEALNYRDYLRAAELRDDIEQSIVHLNVLPPVEAMLDTANRPMCKLERKAQREALKAAEQAKQQEQEISTEIVKEEVEEILPELRPVSKEQLAMRKSYMEQATKMETVLQGYETALLEVRRVHKVVKGGTTMSMKALVVIGNRNGVAGYGEGKSDTGAHAIERACRDAKRNLLCINRFQDRTINNRVLGKYVRSQVSLWPAPRGTGISANNNFASVLQLFGIKDIGAKLHGPRSLSNSIKALFNALSLIRTEESILSTRGLKELPHFQVAKKPGIRRRARAL